jgi:hypothetical protein
MGVLETVLILGAVGVIGYIVLTSGVLQNMGQAQTIGSTVAPTPVAETPAGGQTCVDLKGEECAGPGTEYTGGLDANGQCACRKTSGPGSQVKKDRECGCCFCTGYPAAGIGPGRCRAGSSASYKYGANRSLKDACEECADTECNGEDGKPKLKVTARGTGRIGGKAGVTTKPILAPRPSVRTGVTLKKPSSSARCSQFTGATRTACERASLSLGEELGYGFAPANEYLKFSMLGQQAARAYRASPIGVKDELPDNYDPFFLETGSLRFSMS